MCWPQGWFPRAGKGDRCPGTSSLLTWLFVHLMGWLELEGPFSKLLVLIASGAFSLFIIPSPHSFNCTPHPFLSATPQTYTPISLKEDELNQLHHILKIHGFSIRFIQVFEHFLSGKKRFLPFPMWFVCFKTTLAYFAQVSLNTKKWGHDDWHGYLFLRLSARMLILSWVFNNLAIQVFYSPVYRWRRWGIPGYYR